MKLRMKMHLIFALFIFSFILSGCTDSFNYGNGVVINKFSFNPTLVEAGQPVNLMLDIQNQGQFTAENVYIYQYGLRDEWKMVSGDDASKGIDVGIIEAPVIEGNRVVSQGEIKYFDWLFTAPSDVKSSDMRKNTIFSRICYGYKTVASAKLKLISSNEWSSKTSKDRIDVTVSKGPISMKIESMQPIIILPERKGHSVLKVSIDNIGGGNFIASGKDKCKNLSKIDEDDLNLIDDVVVMLDGDTKLCEFDDQIFLRKGDSQIFNIICEDLDILGSPEKDIDLNIEFRYNYYLDSRADVDLRGVDR